MTATNEITSITQFMDWVRECTLSTNVNKSETPEFFYRGHADINYQFQPSVYRTDKDGKSYRAVEYQLYQDMLRHNPAAFSEDKTLFERLVRMQHHGLPTRLLDVTQSPLVALYFACCEHNNEDGKVMFFSMPQLAVTYSTALRDTHLAGIEAPLTLSNLGNHIISELMNYFRNVNLPPFYHEAFNGELEKFLSDITAHLQRMTSYPDVMHRIEGLNIVENVTTQTFFTNLGESLKKRFFESERSEQEILQNARLFLISIENGYLERVRKIIDELCERIGVRYSYDWNNRLHHFLSEFTYFNFVCPPLNNERIRRQQGAFLIFPPIKSELWTVDHFHQALKIQTYEFVITAKNKNILLKELVSIGITQGYLFPELEKQAEEVKLRYPPS